jgi:Uncharacterized protein conserved in bacteria
MEKKAIISISSNQVSSNEDSVEVLTPGSFYEVEDFYQAIYNETEISGMEGTVTKLQIFSDKLFLVREGTTSTKMEFEKNKIYTTLYNTPYGALELKIDTKQLEIKVNEKGGEVFIDYNMGIAGQKPQKTELKINIKVQ